MYKGLAQITQVKLKEKYDTFCVESLDEILADYVESGDNNGKALYRRIFKQFGKERYY